MPPVQTITAEHAGAVLVRGCVDELRYPRLCVTRQCRRHKRCIDIADRTPRCVASLQASDFDQLVRLYGLVRDIVEDRYPPKPSTDPAVRDHEEEAIMVLLDCIDALPCYRERISAWYDRYDAPSQPEAPPPPAPPAPPVPKTDTGRSLAEMKAEVERYRMIEETRAETEALRRRLAARTDGRA